MIIAGTLLTSGLRAALFQAIQSISETAFWPRIASFVESDKDAEKYAWLGQIPQMERILDDASPKFSTILPSDYTVTNELYKAALAIKRKDLDDDQTGGLDLRIRELATAGVEHLNTLAINLLINGDVAVAAGTAQKASAVAGNKGVVGIAIKTYTSAATGDYYVTVQEGEFLLAGTTLAQTAVGAKVYAEDDATVDETQDANQPLAGICTEVVSASQCWVAIGSTEAQL